MRWLQSSILLPTMARWQLQSSWIRLDAFQETDYKKLYKKYVKYRLNLTMLYFDKIGILIWMIVTF